MNQIRSHITEHRCEGGGFTKNEVNFMSIQGADVVFMHSEKFFKKRKTDEWQSVAITGIHLSREFFETLKEL